MCSLFAHLQNQIERNKEKTALGICFDYVFIVKLGLEARIVLVLTRAILRLSCRTAEHGARIIKQIHSLRTQPIAASSRSTIWSGGNGLRWVPLY